MAAALRVGLLCIRAAVGRLHWDIYDEVARFAPMQQVLLNLAARIRSIQHLKQRTEQHFLTGVGAL